MEIKQIKGFEGLYEITEFGDVFAMERIVKSRRKIETKINF